MVVVGVFEIGIMVFVFDKSRFNDLFLFVGDGSDCYYYGGYGFFGFFVYGVSSSY